MVYYWNCRQRMFAVAAKPEITLEASKMNNRTYRKDVAAMATHAMAMSVEGLKDCILDDWNDPQWPSVTFDAMNLALQRKIGKRQYDAWFNSLPIKSEV